MRRNSEKNVGIDRRLFVSGLSALAVLAVWPPTMAQDAEDASLEELDYPAFERINPTVPYGSSMPTKAQIDKARAIWTAAPQGPTPVDIVDYFVENYVTSDPDAISQWPKSEAWNPLVVQFFSVVSYQAENDLVPWCAAFANWCLKRARRIHSGSAASQSFLWNADQFAKTSRPKRGDLAVFTCYYPGTNKSTGLGHVGFVDVPPSSGAKHLQVIGGNQAQDGRSMICSRRYSLEPVATTRTINGKRTDVTFRFNSYIRVP